MPRTLPYAIALSSSCVSPRFNLLLLTSGLRTLDRRRCPKLLEAPDRDVGPAPEEIAEVEPVRRSARKSDAAEVPRRAAVDRNPEDGTRQRVSRLQRERRLSRLDDVGSHSWRRRLRGIDEEVHHGRPEPQNVGSGAGYDLVTLPFEGGREDLLEAGARSLRNLLSIRVADTTRRASRPVGSALPVGAERHLDRIDHDLLIGSKVSPRQQIDHVQLPRPDLDKLVKGRRQGGGSLCRYRIQCCP